MSTLELMLKENPGKRLEFGPWYLKSTYLFYKHDTAIYSILPMLGQKEITFFMSNGLTFELKIENDKILFMAMSVSGKPISVDYDYKWVN